MRSNYKRIGKYIQLVDERNKGLNVDTLLGLTVNKNFIPSVANIVGTDLANYKIIRKGQFACSLMQVRRDKKIPVALLRDYDEAIISQAYSVFKIIDIGKLLPEYLMMWMSRSEFDREACFYAVGGVRGSLEWEDFSDMQLPVPSIEKQWEIVKEYHTIVNRIKLNEQLNQKLEETVRAIYKQWFLDFEFPISAEYAASTANPELEGEPYKSCDGEMVYNEDLDQDIPKGWEYRNIQSLIDDQIIDKNQDGNHGEIHPKSTDFVDTGVPFVMAKDIINGVLDLNSCQFISRERASKLRIGFSKSGDVLLTHKATMGRVAIVPDIENFIVLTPQVTYYRVINRTLINKEYLYCLFNSSSFQNILCGESEQSTRSYLGITNQRLIKIILPDVETIALFASVLKPMLEMKHVIMEETKSMGSLQEALVSKMFQVAV